MCTNVAQCSINSYTYIKIASVSGYLMLSYIEETSGEDDIEVNLHVPATW